uniref:Uncharacterized protein n=1 Tax=Aegilops tauschii subsp. strangulata TaxID=200361 RepID=A0A453HNT5_AEGTS
MENFPFTKQTSRNICGNISREQAEDDVLKVLDAFREIQAGDPDFSYRVLADSESKIKNIIRTNRKLNAHVLQAVHEASI